MQRTPAGFPLGMPGIGDEIEGAMQQAPQLGLQSIMHIEALTALIAKPLTESHGLVKYPVGSVQPRHLGRQTALHRAGVG